MGSGGISRPRTHPPVPQILGLSRQKDFCPADSEASGAMGAAQKWILLTRPHALIIGSAQEPGEPCLMVEGNSGSSWEGPKNRIREGLEEVFSIDSESK